MKKFITTLTLLLALISIQTFAQTPCANLLTDEYISDGQFYTTKINVGESQKCEITFIEGNEYRLIACPQNASKVQMQIIDVQGNILFDNKNFNYTNYWNFRIKETLTCTIKLTLPKTERQSDEVVLLVGFKK